MNKTEIYQYLTENNIWYEITKHEAVYNMEELKAVELPYPEWDAKICLFVMTKKEIII